MPSNLSKNCFSMKPTKSSKMEYLENQSRRINIRVSGITESADKTWQIVEEKVKKAIGHLEWKGKRNQREPKNGPDGSSS